MSSVLDMSSWDKVSCSELTLKTHSYVPVKDLLSLNFMKK